MRIIHCQCQCTGYFAFYVVCETCCSIAEPEVQTTVGLNHFTASTYVRMCNDYTHTQAQRGIRLIHAGSDHARMLKDWL